MVTISLFEHKSVKTVLTESFEYFKIRGDLEEVVIRKNIPNWIPYPYELSQNFLTFYLFFPCEKANFEFNLNSKTR
jgi:hypothetical protein